MKPLRPMVQIKDLLEILGTLDETSQQTGGEQAMKKSIEN